MNIAHYFTLTRLVISPLFFVLYAYHFMLGISPIGLPYWLLALAIISEISDVLDGQIARRKNLVTELGKILDPMADTIFKLTVFLTFTQGVVQLPVCLVLLLFYREMVVSTLRTLCALRGVALAARLSGKIKTVMQGIAILFILALMIPYSLGKLDLGVLQTLSAAVVAAVVAYSLYSGAEYIYVNRSYISL